MMRVGRTCESREYFIHSEISSSSRNEFLFLYCKFHSVVHCIYMHIYTL